MIRIIRSKYDKNKIAICFGRTVRHVSFMEALKLSLDLSTMAHKVERQRLVEAFMARERVDKQTRRAFRVAGSDLIFKAKRIGRKS